MTTSCSAPTLTCRRSWRHLVPPQLASFLMILVLMLIDRPDPASSLLLHPVGTSATPRRFAPARSPPPRGLPSDDYSPLRLPRRRRRSTDVISWPLPLANNPSRRGGGEGDKALVDEAWDMSLIEREVHDSARERMDWRTVRGAVGLESSPTASSSATASKDERQSGGGRWEVALYSGAACGLLTYLLLHSYVFSAIVAGAAVFVASGDPLEEEGAAGAAARIIGRTTIQTVEASKPKVRAVARAAVGGTDAEWQALESRVAELEGENARLRLQVERLTSARRYQDQYNQHRGVMPSNSSTPPAGGTTARKPPSPPQGGVGLRRSIPPDVFK